MTSQATSASQSPPSVDAKSNTDERAGPCICICHKSGEKALVDSSGHESPAKRLRERYSLLCACGNVLPRHDRSGAGRGLKEAGTVTPALTCGRCDLSSDFHLNGSVLYKINVQMDDDLVKEFSLLRIYEDAQSDVCSIDWDASGDVLLCCGKDKSITLQSLSRNTVRHHYSRKYGAQCGRFVRHSQSHCVVAGRTEPDASPSPAASILEALDYQPSPSVLYATLDVATRSDVGEKKSRWSVAPSPEGKSSSPAQTSQPAPPLPPVNLIRPSVVSTSLRQDRSISPPDSAPGALRLWDLVENRFVRTFQLSAPFAVNGSLSVSSPPTNFILTPCGDPAVRLYTLDKDTALTCIQTQIKSPLACMASNGSAAAIQLSASEIQLHDFNKDWAKSEYMRINIGELLASSPMLRLLKRGSTPPRLMMTNLLMNSVPSFLFVTLTDVDTTERYVLQLCIITGRLLHVFASCAEETSTEDHSETSSLPPPRPKLRPNLIAIPIMDPDVSPDSAYLALGQSDQSILIWNVASGQRVTRLNCDSKIPSILRWNPSLALLASARNHVALWGLDYDDLI